MTRDAARPTLPTTSLPTTLVVGFGACAVAIAGFIALAGAGTVANARSVATLATAGATANATANAPAWVRSAAVAGIAAAAVAVGVLVARPAAIDADGAPTRRSARLAGRIGDICAGAFGAAPLAVLVAIAAASVRNAPGVLRLAAAAAVVTVAAWPPLRRRVRTAASRSAGRTGAAATAAAAVGSGIAALGVTESVLGTGGAAGATLDALVAGDAAAAAPAVCVWLLLTAGIAVAAALAVGHRVPRHPDSIPPAPATTRSLRHPTAARAAARGHTTHGASA